MHGQWGYFSCSAESEFHYTSVLLNRVVLGPLRVLPSQFLRQANLRLNPWDDGSTAVAAYVDGMDVWVANAGDSRAILVLGNGEALALSEDHKPNRPDERDRIIRLGGHVIFFGVWRVQGVLAVSRAIGDRMLKPLVPPTPEVTRHRIERGDARLVLATDGLWDVMDNAQAAAIVHRCATPQQAASKLVAEALGRGTTDNVTALVVDLAGAADKVAAATAGKAVAGSSTLASAAAVAGKLEERGPAATGDPVSVEVGEVGTGEDGAGAEEWETLRGRRTPSASAGLDRPAGGGSRQRVVPAVA